MKEVASILLRDENGKVVLVNHLAAKFAARWICGKAVCFVLLPFICIKCMLIKYLYLIFVIGKVVFMVFSWAMICRHLVKPLDGLEEKVAFSRAKREV